MDVGTQGSAYDQRHKWKSIFSANVSSSLQLTLNNISQQWFKYTASKPAKGKDATIF